MFSKKGVRVSDRVRSFAYFDNSALRSLIQEHVSIEKVRDVPLLITATNLRTGDLETFYTSDLVDEMVRKDQTLGIDNQRLRGYRRINDETTLVSVLLASSAVPFYFPPVSIGDDIYIDGGVGNNTPTRQAAYFNRYLQRLGKGDCEFVLCNVLAPERFTEEIRGHHNLAAVVGRTIDLFQNTMTDAVVRSWEQINKNVESFERRKAEILRLLDEVGLDDRNQARLRSAVEGLSLSVGDTSRLNTPLYVVRPSSPIPVDNVLDFDPVKAKDAFRDGYTDGLLKLSAEGHLTEDERKSLANDPTFKL